jgi:hypothetical protein
VTIDMLAVLGALGLLLVLAVLAVISQISDNETSFFSIAVGVVLVFAAAALLEKAGVGPCAR